MNSLINRQNIYNKEKPFSKVSSAFDLSHIHATNHEIGKLIPVTSFLTLPGDRFKISIAFKTYMESLLKNGFYNLKMNFRAYWLPLNEMWPSFRSFISGGRSGNFQAIPPKFQIDNTNDLKHTLADYFGYSLKKNKTYKVNAFQWMMYDLIYYWYFINQHVEKNLPYIITDEDNTLDNIPGLCSNRQFYDKSSNMYIRMFKNFDNYKQFLMEAGYPEIALDNDAPKLLNFVYNVNYVKDRYTSAHLTQQLGTPPTLPVDINAAFNFNNNEPDLELLKISADNVSNVGNLIIKQGQKIPEFNNNADNEANVVASTDRLLLENWNTLFKNVLNQTATSFSVPDLRLAFQTQIIQEGTLLGGWEYQDYIKYFFGTDVGIDRIPSKPVYCGGFKTPLAISDVFSTVATTDDPLGTYAGKSVTEDNQFLCDYVCKDFGILMIVAYVDVNGSFYGSQGIPEEFNFHDRFDMVNPAFYHLSEQGINHNELYLSTASSTAKPFGFGGIYNVFRQKTDFISGDLRDELSFWHSARFFNEVPNLNPEFLKVKQKDYDRLFAVSSDNFKPFISAFGVKALAYRPLPELAVPGLIDHR
nr:MAG: major capsid protein [Microvirus Sku113]